MSEFLNSLNTPEATGQSWAAEVAAAEATEAPAAAPEAVEPEPAPELAPAAEAAPAPAPAAEAAPAPAPEATEEDDRRVPLKALHEERAKRAEYERKLDEALRRMAELEQRTKAPEPEAAPDPDPETDPIGALKAAKAELRRMSEEAQRQQYEARLNAVAYNAAVEFSQQAPDYKDAYQYAVKSRAQELAVLGVDQNAIPEIIKREELSLIDGSVRAGRNPAQAIYEFAKARGYARQAPAPVAAPAPAAPDPALMQAKKAVAASASAGGAPASKGEISDADAVNLKGAAFDAYWNKKFGGNKSSMFRE
jgi:hypothetical protein